MGSVNILGIYASPEAAIIEPYDIPEFFASGGLGKVEFLSSGHARLVFCGERGGERIAQFAMIISVDDAIRGMARLSSEITGGLPCDAFCARKKRLG